MIDKFNDFDKNFRLMSKFITFCISFVFIFIVLYLLFMGVFVYKMGTSMVEQDWSNGVKPVIEQFWCGKPGCSDKE
jgi:hypothetical protein